MKAVQKNSLFSVLQRFLFPKQYQYLPFVKFRKSFSKKRVLIKAKSRTWSQKTSDSSASTLQRILVLTLCLSHSFQRQNVRSIRRRTRRIQNTATVSIFFSVGLKCVRARNASVTTATS